MVLCRIKHEMTGSGVDDYFPMQVNSCAWSTRIPALSPSEIRPVPALQSLVLGIKFIHMHVLPRNGAAPVSCA